ncbi:MAG: hypothetical protein Q9190_004131 [Brigantiaea leucoxantha]
MPPHPKSSNPTRRVSSSLSKVATPPTSARASKSSKQRTVAILKLPPKVLSRFPHEAPSAKPSPPPAQPAKKSSASTSAAAMKREQPKLPEVKPETMSPPPMPSSSGTPQPSANDSATSRAGAKSGSPKAGTKRGLGAGVDSSKPRARPGPKKKIKLDEHGEPVKGASINPPAPAHKLGPKANQGAINAGLRALDRTGTPCRKWHKKGFYVKTFTGVSWELPSWHSPFKSFDSNGVPDKDSLPTSNSQSKENNSSSNVGSENSPAPLALAVEGHLDSSPLPGMSIAA